MTQVFSHISIFKVSPAALFVIRLAVAWLEKRHDVYIVIAKQIGLFRASSLNFAR